MPLGADLGNFKFALCFVPMVQDVCPSFLLPVLQQGGRLSFWNYNPQQTEWTGSCFGCGVFYHGNRKAASSLLQWELVKELCRCVCTGDHTAMCEVWTLGLDRADYFDFPQLKLDLRDS